MNAIQALKNPPPEFSPCAFWFWNGTLNGERLLWQMEEMLEKGVYNAFMHARAYLKTPYMGDAWFQVMDGCVRRAREIGFRPWLYDEYAWPSGTCGSIFSHGFQAPSKVLAAGKGNMAKGLDVYIADDPMPGRTEIAACALPDGRTMRFYEHVYEKAVDYLNPAAIRCFLDCTHEVYAARYGAVFGKVIPGIFFDEIYLAAHPLPWTEALPERFLEAYGYDLLPELPYLMQGGGARAETVRGDYYALVAALYEQAFFRQIADWCKEHSLLLTGHTEEDLLRHPRRQGDYFRTMRHLQVPGADCHDYRYRFPREISIHEPKYAVSVARAYEKPRAMSEAMGGAGWGCSLQEYKRGVNALGAAGVSMFILHGFYNECEHQGSQADWPASLFTQNPYWKYFRHFAQYIHRVSVFNTLGRAAVDVGLYYPAAEMAANTLGGEPNETARTIDAQYHQALRAFWERQIDIDLIDRDSLCAATIANGRLCAGAQQFRLLIFPANLIQTDALRETLRAFAAQGGAVLCYPTGETTAPDCFAPDCVCGADMMPARYLARFAPDFTVLAGAREHLHACCREVEGNAAYFIASTLPKARQLQISLRGQGAVRRLSLETGADEPVAYTQETGRVTVRLTLEADEACCLLTGCAPGNIPPAETAVRCWALNGPWAFLPLDETFDHRWAADAAETALTVPIADFLDVQTGYGEQIRIRNTANEPGRCGRHVSLWKAKWLGRRVGWGDDADKKDLYFIKTFAVKGRVLAAPVCVAAVNWFTLTVNGREAARAVSDGKPAVLELGPYLREGENVLAVHVHTDTPLDSRELTQAEAIPPDALASLLLQGTVRTERGEAELLTDASWAVAAAPPPGWPLAVPEAVREIDPKAVLCHVAPGLADRDFVKAWERGRPPMQPWGDLPLFGQTAAYPRPLTYAVTLPAGTACVEPPDAKGAYAAYLDDTPVSFADGALELPPDGRPHTLRLELTAADGRGGLQSGVRVRVRPLQAALGDWRGHGLSWFSGRALYRQTVTLQKEPGLRYALHLGRVCFSAEIWVNNSLCGTRVWEPYTVDITAFLRDGDNEIAVVAANSAAVARRQMLVDEGMALAWNRYWNEDNIDREPENLLSGLLGPVTITAYARAEGETPAPLP